MLTKLQRHSKSEIVSRKSEEINNNNINNTFAIIIKVLVISINVFAI